jgi:hypothetical protein
VKLAPLPRYAVGVDPGKQTGIGVYDRKHEKIVQIKTTDFWGVIPWLERTLRLTEVKVYVEINAAFMYDRNDEIEDKKRDRYMLNVGGVRREGQLLLEGLRLAGIDAEEVRPIREKKWTPEQFRALCKSNRTTNEHERDACRIAFSYANKRKELER